jgi:hypothetical protein
VGSKVLFAVAVTGIVISLQRDSGIIGHDRFAGAETASHERAKATRSCLEFMMSCESEGSWLV